LQVDARGRLAGVARRGAYRYYLNGAPEPVSEHWQVVAGARGWRLACERRAGAIALGLQCPVTGDWADLTECELSWREDGGPTRRAEYRLDGKGVEVVVRDGDAAPRREHFPVREALLSPLMRATAGPVLAAMAERAALCPVLVPRIETPQQRDTLLLPSISYRSALNGGRERIELRQATWEADCYAYQGGPYTGGARYWVHPRGLLLCYEWQENEERRWRVELELQD
jgi:hypothetical protein